MMKVRTILAIGLMCAVADAAVRSDRQERMVLSSFEQSFMSEDVSKPTPIQRVVKLLGEMKAQLDKEVAGDAEMYDKMVCWCETNDKQKTKAISNADSSISNIESDAQAMSARSGELATKITAMKSEIAAKKESLGKATAIREKEQASFSAEEKETIQAVSMLKNAIQILGKHNAGLLQMTPAIQESMGAALEWVSMKHEEVLAAGVEHGFVALRGSAESPKSVASLLSVASQAAQANDAASVALDNTLLSALSGTHAASDLPLSFGERILKKAAGQASSLVQTAQPDNRKSYAPQSSAIFGILRQMQEDFESNLSSDQKEEIKASGEFVELRAASTKAIEASSAKLDEMEDEFASNTKALSDANEDLEMTRTTRSADVKFLMDLKGKCRDLDTEYAKRSKARGEEVKAVAETIAMLTEDDARTLFAKKMGSASFFQVKAADTAAMKARNRAMMVLLQAARQIQKRQPDLMTADFQVWRTSDQKPHEQLAAIAVQVQLDAFTKVKKAIDSMVADLKEQQENEVKKKDYCTKEFGENEKMTYTNKEALADLVDKIASLDANLKKLNEETVAARAEIAQMEVAVKQASEDREKENAEFQEEITDQRMMQAILKKALDRMKVVYKSALLQQEPPMKFAPSKQNAGSSPVIGLLEQIIGDSKSVEGDALAGEQEAQKTYEEFVVNSNASLQALNDAIASKADSIAQATLEKSESESQKTSTENRVSDLEEYNGDLHSDCDFVMKNFDVRQSARLQEMEALKNAKAYLDGQQ